MICHTCGQPAHPATDCVTALRIALLVETLKANDLYDACKAARDYILRNTHQSNVLRSPTLAQIELAIRASK